MDQSYAAVWPDFTPPLTGVVRSELIPTADEQALAWLEDLRDPLLFDLKDQNEEVANFRDWLGRVGESIVVESERQQGRRVRQVSLISDSYGFDVESIDDTGRRCIEVKTALESTRSRFFISKNEVTKAATFHKEWHLVQVILRQDALADELITNEHIFHSRTLEATSMIELVPTDTETGVWVDSARITPPKDDWSTWELSVPACWCFPGYNIDRR